MVNNYMGEVIIMDLSEKDRLFLYNQCEILRILNIDDEYEVSKYEKYKEILSQGYEQLYGQITSGFEETVSIDITNFVYDVLDMYAKLLFSYYHLPKTEQDKIDIEDIKSFDGFDGNNELDHKLFVDFLFKHEKAYPEISEYCNTNSHAHRVGKYRRMLDIYNNIKTNDYLTLEQIQQVVK